MPAYLKGLRTQGPLRWGLTHIQRTSVSKGRHLLAASGELERGTLASLSTSLLAAGARNKWLPLSLCIYFILILEERISQDGRAWRGLEVCGFGALGNASWHLAESRGIVYLLWEQREILSPQS